MSREPGELTMKLNIKTTVQRDFSLEIDADRLRDLININLSEQGYPLIPAGADMFVTVPGGGDWSNMALSLSSCPVEVHWSDTGAQPAPFDQPINQEPSDADWKRAEDTYSRICGVESYDTKMFAEQFCAHRIASARSGDK